MRVGGEPRGAVPHEATGHEATGHEGTGHEGTGHERNRHEGIRREGTGERSMTKIGPERATKVTTKPGATRMAERAPGRATRPDTECVG